MKMIKILDSQGTILVSDALNQLILQKLVVSPFSITDLSKDLNITPLKVWRRMQQLTKAKLVEVSKVEKVGNLEKKLYRATALRYDVPQQFFKPKLTDPNLQAAFAKYAEIQNDMLTILSQFDADIPKEGDPTDFAIYALMQAYVKIKEEPSTQENVQEMKQKLKNYEREKLAHLKS